MYRKGRLLVYFTRERAYKKVYWETRDMSKCFWWIVLSGTWSSAWSCCFGGVGGCFALGCLGEDEAVFAACYC